MTQGGVLSGTSTLVAGSAGTGKTLLGLHFLLEGVRLGEPGLLVTFQETPSMLRAFSRGFGWDVEKPEADGMLHLLYSSPVEMGVDEHAQVIRDAIAKTGARRIVLDSLKDIELATSDKVRYKDYIYALVNEFRRQGITSLLTSEVADMFGDFTVSEFGISFVTDNVILLRYVEMEGHIARALSVLKMRGSEHDKSVREYQITHQNGLEILQSFKDYGRVLSGSGGGCNPSSSEVLSPCARRMLRVVDQKPGCRLDELMEACGGDPRRTRGSTGYLERRHRDGDTVYVTTVV